MESICEKFLDPTWGFRFPWLEMRVRLLLLAGRQRQALPAGQPGNLIRSRVAGVAAWSGAERAANRVPGGGRRRGGGPRADDPPGGGGAGSLVPVAAAALHRLGAGGAPGKPPGAAALARAAAALAAGWRARRPGRDRP